MWDYILSLVVIPLLVGLILDWLLFRMHNRKKYSIAYEEPVKHIYMPHEAGDLAISISYKGVPIEKAVILFSVIIANNGKEDIFYEKHFSGPVKMRTNHLQYLNVSVRNAGSSSPVASLSEDGGANLSWDILKKKEKIIVDVVASMVDDECLESPESIRTEFIFRADCLDTFSKSDNKFEQLNKAKYYAYFGVIAMYAIIISITSLTRINIGFDLNSQGREYHNAGVYYNAFTNQYYISSADKCRTKVLTEDLSKIVGSQPTPKPGYYLYLNMGIILLFLIITFICIHIMIKENRGYYHLPIEKEIL